MALQGKAGFSGLVTATAEATGAPSGLRIADNVTLRKEGALMPRPASASTALSRQYLTAVAYKGSLFYIGRTGASSGYTLLGLYSPAQVQLTLLSTYAAARADIISAKEARGNLYLPSAFDTFKITSPASTALLRAGLNSNTVAIHSWSLTTTGSPLILAANQRVAYRIVSKHTDPNGVIVRSRPSGACVVESGASAAAPSLFLRSYNNGIGPYADNAIADEVEIYRTRVFPNTITVDDEMQLVASIKMSQFAPGIFPFTYTFVDRVPESARGTTLYTSPSRGGIENANDRPPAAACIERYRTSLFFGNTRGPRRLTFSWKYATSGNLVGQASGIGKRTVTGNTTNGSAQITSVSNMAGIQVGQVVQGANVNGYILSIAGSTLTLSNNATATASGVSLNAIDTIHFQIGSTGFFTYVMVPPTSAATNGTAAASVPGADALFNAYEVTPAVPGYDVTITVEYIYRGDSNTLSFKATHGDEYQPPIPLLTDPTPVYAPFDDFPQGLAWSEPDEPEHVPPKNFARVGDAGKAILALVATKDRLLIFKEDGLFMLTGDTARNFGIYPLDTTCLCILPGSVRRLKNTVYALTNLGLVAVDDGGGVTVVSRPIQLEVAAIVNAIRAAQKTSGLYYMPGLTGVTGAGDDAQGEYHLALGSSTPSFGGQVLVYSIPRDGFTTFSFGTPAPVALATDGEGNPLVLTASSLLTPTTTLGAIAARVSPRAFSDPAMLNKFWTHIAAGFSQLTGTTSVQARFTSSESQVAANVTETLEAPPLGGLVEHPLGTLMRHPVPRAVQRAYLLFVELLINVSSGTFTLEAIAAESRDNASNKKPTHGSGAT